VRVDPEEGWFVSFSSMAAWCRVSRVVCVLGLVRWWVLGVEGSLGVSLAEGKLS